jgi:tetratricopeptide (TPR) repeat protein
MSKPMLITLPAVLLLVDYWPLKRCEGLARPFQGLFRFGGWRTYLSRNSLILEKLPFLLLSILSAMATVYAQHKGQAVSDFVVLPFGNRVVNAVNSYFDYLLKLFWPDNLAVFYPYPGSIDFGASTFELIVLAAISFAALKYARKYPFIIVGWLWFIITLLPVIGMIQVGKQAMADRYTYFPSIGVFMIVAFGLPILVGRFTQHRHVLAVASTCAIMACMYVSWTQLAHWKTSFSLFSHALQVTQKNAVAHLKLATAFSKSSRPDEAMYHYSEASRFDSLDAEAYNGMGWQFFIKGKPEESIPLFQKALKLKPDSDLYHLNLGAAYAQAGESELAIQHFGEAVRLNPDNGLARKNLKVTADELSSKSFHPATYPSHPDSAEEINRLYKAALKKGKTGNFDEAVHYYRRIISLNSEDARAYYYLGILHIFQRRIGEAISCFKEAVKLNPEFYESHYNLAVASGIVGDREGFFRYLNQCLGIKPDYYMAYNQLGLYFLKQGENGKAIDHFRKAIEYFPEFDEAHNNLAIALVQSGKKQEGLSHFRRALQINPEYAEAKRNIEVYGKK